MLPGNNNKHMSLVLLIAAAISTAAATVPLSSSLNRNQRLIARNKTIGQGPFCSSKSSHQSFQACPITQDGIHAICNSVQFWQADEACADFGWKLADITPDLVDAALDVSSSCLDTPYAWIKSWNGYVQDPCMLFDFPGLAFDAIPNCSFITDAGALCQDITTSTLTIVSTQTVTTSVGVTTDIIPTYNSAHCSKPAPPPAPCQHCHKPSEGSSSSCHRSDQHAGPPHLKRGGQTPPPPFCPVVCPLEIGHLRLVLNATNLEGAVSTCELFGWTLADVTTGEFQALEAMMDACTDRQFSTGVLFNSWNGVVSNCTGALFVDQFGNGHPIVFMNSIEDTCQSTSFFVVCQDAQSPPAFTGTGPWPGLYSLTSVFVNTTITITEPTSTRTLTSFAPSPLPFFFE